MGSARRMAGFLAGTRMPRVIKPLSAREVEALREPGAYAVGGVPGLHLAVNARSGRSWLLRYSAGGKRREMGLGPARLVGLAAAREKAREARLVIAGGNDPLEARCARRAAEAAQRAKTMSFVECAEAFIKSRERGWAARTAKLWRASLRD